MAEASTTQAEYRLLVMPAFNERTRRQGTMVVLQTTKSFANFRYTLSVEDRLEGNTLHLKVLGLKAPSLDLPSAGPAEFRGEYEGFSGSIRIVVEGLHSSHSAIDAEVAAEGVTLKGDPAGNPIEVELPSATRLHSRP